MRRGRLHARSPPHSPPARARRGVRPRAVRHADAPVRAGRPRGDAGGRAADWLCAALSDGVYARGRALCRLRAPLHRRRGAAARGVRARRERPRAPRPHRPRRLRPRPLRPRRRLPLRAELLLLVLRDDSGEQGPLVPAVHRALRARLDAVRPARGVRRTRHAAVAPARGPAAGPVETRYIASLRRCHPT